MDKIYRKKFDLPSKASNDKSTEENYKLNNITEFYGK
jgi:hypothetical protein